MKNFFLVAILCLVIAYPLIGQVQQITSLTLGDGTANSFPGVLAVTENFVYLAATEESTGTELWKTDGTASGTALIADINPGKGSSMNSFITSPLGVVSGNAFYFVANNGIDGQQVWKTDGTETGTMALTDFNVGTIGNIVETNGEVFFFHYTEFNNTSSLWRSDGTAAGTQMVISNIDGNTEGYREFAWNGHLYFWVSTEGFNLYDLWVSDGTPNGGSVLLEDIVYSRNDPYNNPTIEPLYEYNGKLYGIFGTEQTPSSLYEIDAKTINKVKEFFESSIINFGEFISDATVLNERLYFILYDFDTQSIKLIETDGSEENTKVLLEQFDEFGELPNMSNIISLGDKLYFSFFGDNDETNLVNYDPQNNILNQLGEIDMKTNIVFYDPDFSIIKLYKISEEQAAIRSLSGSFKIQNDTLEEFDDRAYLFAHNGVYNSQYIFASSRANQFGSELWRYSATDNEIGQIIDINQTKQSRVFSLVPANDKLFFIAETQENPELNLFSYDGGTEGLQNLTLSSNVSLSKLSNIIPLGDKLIFISNEPERNGILWSSMGDALNTTRLVEIDTLNPSRATGLLKIGDKVYFENERTDSGQSTIYVTDGTQEGTIPIYDAPLLDSTTNTFLTIINYSDIPNGLVLEARDPSNNFTELLLINDLENPTPKSIFKAKFLSSVTGTNNKIYFAFQDTLVGSETTIGFYDLIDQSSGQLDRAFHEFSFIRPYTTIGDKLIFEAFSPDIGQELWITNGVDFETFILDIDDGPGNGFNGSKNIVNTGEYIYFAAKNDTLGMELWRYDGTLVDPIVFDIVPGPESSSPNPLSFIDGILYFSAYTSELGTELWQTDGTEEGTRLVVDVLPGPKSSNPIEIIKIGNTLYFIACADDLDRQVWRFDILTGVKEKLLSNLNLNLFPNPVVESFQIDFESATPMHAFLYNSNGQLVRQIPNVLPNQSITVKDLLPGSYSLKLVGEGNYGVIQFIKQ